MSFPKQTLSNLCDDVVVGHVGPSSGHRKDDGVPFLMGKNVGPGFLKLNDLERVTPQFHRSQQKSHLQPGDVIVVRIGKSGQAAKIPETLGEANCSGLVVIKRPRGVTADYLVHFLNSPEGRQQSLAETKGSTRQTLNTQSVAAAKIPVPSLGEQRRIAEVLDRAEALRAKRRAALAQLDTLTQSIFLDLFGDPATNPKGWEMLRLQDVLSIPLRNGLSPSHVGKITAKVLTLSAITGSGFDDSAWKVSTFRSPPPSDQSVDENDFLICRGNGNVRLVGKGYFPTRRMPDITFPDTMIAARVRTDRLERVFLQHIWGWNAVRRQVESLARTTNGTFKVNQTMLEGITFIGPPLQLQREFAHRVGAADKLKTAQRTSLAELDALFAVLQHRAFRGEL